VALIQGQKRLSIRATALRYGIPSRVVARAVWLGELSAIKTTTEKIRRYQEYMTNRTNNQNNQNSKV
jgi:hypothetical protein